jgi:hypothetical protein
MLKRRIVSFVTVKIEKFLLLFNNALSTSITPIYGMNASREESEKG